MSGGSRWSSTGRRGAPQARVVACLLLLAGLLSFHVSQAQEARQRSADVSWDVDGRNLYAWFSFREVIDGEIRSKLSRGLPTTVVLTALVYVAGQSDPVAMTVQSCKSTWHVWQEMYRVELTRPNNGGRPLRDWAPTVNGVLRRCAEAQRLLIANEEQVRGSAAVSLRATVRVNPVSPEVLQKIRQWISRPTRPATGNPGGALFSTFTGLFLANIGEAERVIEFTTQPRLPAQESVPRN